MTFLTRKTLNRRTLLRGAGTAIALPFLDAMAPPMAAAPNSPARLLWTYVPIGANMEHWTPKAEGRGYEFPRILKPLEPFRQRISVLTHLDCAQGNALGDGPGDHARAGACYLTGVHPKKTAGSDIRAGISVDQIAARHFATETRFASLELGCEDTRIVGACDSGYACAYQNSIAWKTPSTPLPPETNPRMVFERLFGTDDTSLSPQARARRRAARRSILDLVQAETRDLASTLGPADRRKIDEYQTAIREIETRIIAAETENKQFQPGMEKPAGIPVLFSDYLHMMFDLQILAMQADLTRVATFMYGREASLRTYAEIGVPESHHPLTHHRGDKENIEKFTRINCFHAAQFAWFLDRLQRTADGEGTLLDHAMVVYGSGLSDGNDHSHENVPIVLAGGRFAHGKHIVYPKGTPVTNLYLTLLDRIGVRPESVGDSTGRLEHLAEL